MKAFRQCLAAATAAALGLLTACGDSPYDADAPVAAAQAVPASATVSTAAYTAFAASLANTETGEALSVEGVTPPTSENEEGAAVN